MHDTASLVEPIARSADAAPLPCAESPNAPAGVATLTPGRRRPMLAVLLATQLAGSALIVVDVVVPGLLTLVAGHLLLLYATLAPRSSLLGPLVNRFATPRREVWLTIDDGPSADTEAMLDLLDAHAARATFFLVGARAEQWPEQVRAIINRGHSIGNHSHDHRQAWFWATPRAAMQRQVGGAQRALSAIAGEAPRLFRAVVGMANPFVQPALEQHRLLRVGWGARGYDSVIADPARVWMHLRPDVQPGAILLLHEGAPHGASVAILQHVLQQLDQDGYRCVLPVTPSR
jgi:peptidoglycan-N-acetylglucosamine deacetylase